MKLRTENIINFLKSWKDPISLRNHLIYKLVSILYRQNNGFYIFDELWDNLIILDACRYDTFKEVFTTRKITGNLELRISRGAHTTSFLRENFQKRLDNTKSI